MIKLLITLTSLIILFYHNKKREQKKELSRDVDKFLRQLNKC